MSVFSPQTIINQKQLPANISTLLLECQTISPHRDDKYVQLQDACLKSKSVLVDLSVVCTPEVYSVFLSIGLFNNHFNFSEVSLLILLEIRGKYCLHSFAMLHRDSTQQR